MFPNIDAERARIGLSRVGLAEKLNVSYGTMKKWMRGATDIPASKVVEMGQSGRWPAGSSATSRHTTAILSRF